MEHLHHQQLRLSLIWFLLQLVSCSARHFLPLPVKIPMVSCDVATGFDDNHITIDSDSACVQECRDMMSTDHPECIKGSIKVMNDVCECNVVPSPLFIVVLIGIILPLLWAAYRCYVTSGREEAAEEGEVSLPSSLQPQPTTALAGDRQEEQQVAAAAAAAPPLMIMMPSSVLSDSESRRFFQRFYPGVLSSNKSRSSEIGLEEESSPPSQRQQQVMELQQTVKVEEEWDDEAMEVGVRDWVGRRRRFEEHDEEYKEAHEAEEEEEEARKRYGGDGARRKR